MQSSSARTAAFRDAMTAFINERRDAKQRPNQAGDADASKFEYGAWLADAARRVLQIQAATHVLKATHPDARGSSLHFEPADLPHHSEVGSHLIEAGYALDVIGNAAALDVWKFLKIEIEGKPLLDWMRIGDVDLIAALSADPEVARGWMSAFGSLVRPPGEPVTHPMAKQVYWLIGDNPQDDSAYHLLQPMFSSALAHVVHLEIQDTRFGETNKLARQAYRERAASESEYREYPGLVVRKLGGTKPQNISQLNSERGGVNYLLASGPPPAWKAEPLPSVRSRKSMFDAFLWFDDVRRHLDRLGNYLHAVQGQSGNIDTRDRRDALLNSLAEQLAMFGVTVRTRYPAGWTRDPSCRLPRSEQLWLDPERIGLADRADPDHPDWAVDDEAFRSEYDRGDWPDEVAERFGLWLNQRLRDNGLMTLAGPEMRHWVSRTIIDVAWPMPMQRRTRSASI